MDGVDADFRVVLPVALHLLVVLLGPVAEDDDLGAASLCQHGGRDLHALDIGCADLETAGVAQGEDLVEDDFLLGLGFEFFQSYNLIGCRHILMAAI